MHNACLLSVVRSPNNSNKHIHKPSTKQPNNQTIIEVGSTLFWCILFRDSAHHSALRYCTHCKLNATAYTLFFRAKRTSCLFFYGSCNLTSNDDGTPSNLLDTAAHVSGICATVTTTRVVQLTSPLFLSLCLSSLHFAVSRRYVSRYAS